MSERRIRYIVGRDWAERVSDTTALPHRVLRIDEHGDITVTVKRPGWDESGPYLQISAAELRLLAREVRREKARRFRARLGIR